MPLIRQTSDAAPAAANLPNVPDFEAASAALRASDADDRWRAARALGSFAQAAGLLGAAVASEPDARVRETMFTSLARIGTPQSTAALVAHVRSEDANRRTGAMDALKATPRALPAILAKLLRDRDPDVRILACDLARELPSAEATALLATVLDRDREVNVCAAAVDVIADIGSPAALPHLACCAERFADQPFLDFAISIARDRVGTQPPRG